MFEGDMLYSLSKSLAFQIIGKESHCKSNYTIYKSNEGLYLLPANNLTNYNDLVKSKPSTVNKNLLILADSDLSKLQQLMIYKEINQRNCHNLMNILQIVSQFRQNDFFHIRDYEGKELVLYANRNMLFLPKCKIFKKIKTAGSSVDCYKQIPVTIPVESQRLNETTNQIEKVISEELVLLQQDRILRRRTQKVDCGRFEDSYQVVLDSTRTLVKTVNYTGTYIELIKNKYITKKLNNIINDFAQLNFNHFDQITHDYNIFHFDLIEENNYNSYKTLNNLNDNNENNFSIQESLTKAYEKIKSSWHTFKIAISITIFVIVFTLISIFITCLIYRIKRTKNYNRANLIEGFLPQQTTPLINTVSTLSAEPKPRPTTRNKRSMSSDDKDKIERCLDPATEWALKRISRRIDSQIHF